MTATPRFIRTSSAHMSVKASFSSLTSTHMENFFPTRVFSSRLSSRVSSKYYFATATNEMSNTQMQDCFSILGIEKTYSIDPVILKQSYKHLMTELHPDKMNQMDNTNNTDNNQNDVSTINASDVTHAYEIISHPHKRASHLLELNGILIDENDKGESLLGMKFLMTIMETRELIDDTINDHLHHGGGSDGKSLDEKLRDILKQNQTYIDETCTDIEAAFELNNLDKAKLLTAQLQYWFRIEETIIEKLDSVR